MTKALSKNGLIAELAAAAGLEKKAVSSVLDKLTEIAYREAVNGFTVPGICKLKVITKKASRCRNPATGQMLLIGERSVLKIVPLGKARDVITPKAENLIQVITEEPAPAPVVDPTPMAAEPHKMPEDAIPPLPDLPFAPVPSSPGMSEPGASESKSAFDVGGDGGQIVFTCMGCGTLLAAPPSSAGATCNCPSCSVMNLIPSRKGDASKAAGTKKPGTGAAAESRQKSVADFITFVCQTCGQEIEAPIDMMGMDASCPTCASSLHVPASFEGEKADEPVAKPAALPVPGANLSSMTIRIDLSDLE